MRAATVGILVVLLAAPLLILWVASPAAAPAIQPAAQPAAQPVLQPAVFCYAIEGMHCDGCAEAITAELKELHGVTAVECTFASHTAVVHADGATLKPDVERAITKLGYKITPKVAAADKAQEPELAPLVPAGASSSK